MGSTSDGPRFSGGTEPIKDERSSVWHVKSFGQELPVVVHLHSLVAEGLGEGIMLLSRLLGPHHVIEEQIADVVRGEPRELQPRSVDDGSAKLADL